MKSMHKVLAGAVLASALAWSGSALSTDLIQVHRLALDNDPQLRAAEAQRLAQSEFRPQARASLLPFVTFDASYNRIHEEVNTANIGRVGTSDYSVTDLSLSLVQPLFRRDYFVQLKQADSVLALADAQYSVAHQDLMIRAAQAYFGVLAARDALFLARAEKDSVGRQLEQARQRFDVGLIAITDVHVAQAAYDLATAAEIEAANQLQSANEALYELTGEHVDDIRPLQAEIPLVSPAPADVERWVQAAMDQNFTLLAARFNAEIAERNVSLQRAGHYPTLDLVASMGKTDSRSDLAPRDSEDAVIGLQLSVPLFQGGAVRSRTRQANYELAQAREQVEQQRRSTLRATRDAYNAVIAAINRVNALAQARVSARSALEATEAGMEVGTQTAVDVVTTRTELFRAENDYAAARYDYLLNILRLRLAEGSLSITDLRLINRWLQ
ncbi:MAG: TolC family outer membrane protein [Gammaproteobacteria bacterium]|jgi:outer membrane protein|nr:TolC family outer membrane protein [Gammaproteobacteria bacterium]